jgi:hypothetical protein
MRAPKNPIRPGEVLSGLEYVLIGATVMGFHGLVRATEDVDLLIRPTPTCSST